MSRGPAKRTIGGWLFTPSPILRSRVSGVSKESPEGGETRRISLSHAGERWGRGVRVLH